MAAPPGECMIIQKPSDRILSLGGPRFKTGGGAAAAFSPSDLANLTLWYKADAGTYESSDTSDPADADGDAVQLWQDQSGSGMHVSQATVGARPTLKLAIKNSLPVIRFDGADDNMTRASVLGSDILSTDELNWFMVLLQNAAGANNSPVNWSGSGSSNYSGTLISFSNTLYFDASNNSTGRISVAQPTGWDDTFHIVELYRNGLDGEIVVDGTVELSGSFTDPSLDNTQTGEIHVGHQSTNFDFNGDIGEIILYSQALSTGDRASVEAYLASRWAITV